MLSPLPQSKRRSAVTQPSVRTCSRSAAYPLSHMGASALNGPSSLKPNANFSVSGEAIRDPSNTRLNAVLPGPADAVAVRRVSATRTSATASLDICASFVCFHDGLAEPEAHPGKPYSSGVAIAPSFELVGRDRELGRLVDFVTQLRDGPAALLIRGEPGIGKTILWREALAAAEREGNRVLVARCAEAEMPISLGAVSDLLDPVFAEISDDLAEPQRRALAAALGTESATRSAHRPAHSSCAGLSRPFASPRSRRAVATRDRRRPVARPRVGTRALVCRTSDRRGADRRPRDLER